MEDGTQARGYPSDLGTTTMTIQPNASFSTCESKVSKAEKSKETKVKIRKWMSVRVSTQHARQPKYPNPRLNKQNKQKCSFRKYFVAYASIPHLYNLYITSIFMAFLDELLCLCHIKYWMLSVSRFIQQTKLFACLCVGGLR